MSPSLASWCNGQALLSPGIPLPAHEKSPQGPSRLQVLVHLPHSLRRFNIPWSSTTIVYGVRSTEYRPASTQKRLLHKGPRALWSVS